MRILAIDQSYTSSGLVILDDGKILHAEIFSSDANEDIFMRAWAVTEHIQKLAKRFGPDHIAMEGLAFSKFGNATRDLAGLQYMIMGILRFVEGYNVLVISPNTVKKVATGKGNAKKEQLLESLPSDVKSHFEDMGAKKTKGLYDLSDAYWIGQAGIIELENRNDTGKNS
jgi:crossover junction endodeoxyribonuclease RuvC